jgi:CheY-like chemotaxis protein
MEGLLESAGMTDPAAQPEGTAPKEEKTWLFVGDFLFYLRLLARQFANLARAQGLAHKSMVIVPEISMAWDQLEQGKGEVLILDCAESSELQLEFLRNLKVRHPEVRRILVSANLSRQMESELMGAGAHLCFSKPRNLEEAASMFSLVDALANSKGFLPSGNFKGLAPARFIQFLCARNESGRIAMDTEEGEGMLVLKEGQIVDASFGELRGDAAAARILAMARTNRCLFRHMETSQYHTVNLNTHQLWIDSDKVEKAAPAEKPVFRPPPAARSLRETMGALESMENFTLDIHVDSSIEIGTDADVSPKAAVIRQTPNPITAAMKGASFGFSQVPPRSGPASAGSEEVITDNRRQVIFQRNTADAALRAEFLGFIRTKGIELTKRLGLGGLLSIRSEEKGAYWEVEFTPEQSVFRMTKDATVSESVPPPPSKPSPDPIAALEKLAILRASTPATVCGYYDGHSNKAWSLARIGQIVEESREEGFMFHFSACESAFKLHHLPHSRMLWEFESGRVILLSVGTSSFLLGACELSTLIEEVLGVMDRLREELETLVT